MSGQAGGSFITPGPRWFQITLTVLARIRPQNSDLLLNLQGLPAAYALSHFTFDLQHEPSDYTWWCYPVVLLCAAVLLVTRGDGAVPRPGGGRRFSFLSL